MERELLEKLRVKIAKHNNIASYSVFKDEELELLLKAKPKKLSELEGLKGFPKGGARCTKWGEAIVAIFNRKPIADFDIDENGKVIVSIRRSSSF